LIAQLIGLSLHIMIVYSTTSGPQCPAISTDLVLWSFMFI